MFLAALIPDYNFSFCRYVPSFLPPPMATKGKDYEKKASISEKSYNSFLFFLLWVSLVLDIFFILLFSPKFFTFVCPEGGGKAKGKRESEITQHWSFYGGVEAWARDEGKEKPRAWTLAWWTSYRYFYCMWFFLISSSFRCMIKRSWILSVYVHISINVFVYFHGFIFILFPSLRSNPKVQHTNYGVIYIYSFTRWV